MSLRTLRFTIDPRDRTDSLFRANDRERREKSISLSRNNVPRIGYNVSRAQEIKRRMEALPVPKTILFFTRRYILARLKKQYADAVSLFFIKLVRQDFRRHSVVNNASVIAETSGTLRAAGMNNEWDTLSKRGAILLKAARLLALSIHRLSATTSRIFLVGPSLFVALLSIGRLVILNVGDKNEKERGRERERRTLLPSWNRTNREATGEEARQGWS